MFKRIFSNRERKGCSYPLNRMAMFSSADMEEKFRRHHLHNEKKSLASAVWVMAPPTLVFSYSDYILFQFKSTFFLLLSVRLLFLVTGFIIYMILKRDIRIKVFDGLLLYWWLSLAAMILFVNTTRPNTYVHNTAIDILVVFAIYVSIPSRLVNLATAALIFSSANMMVILVVKTGLTPLSMVVLTISYLLANSMGMLVSYRFHVYRRLEFAALQNEKEVSAKLQKALAEIKELRGIIPICSNCKKIRDDKGFWQQVDEYISHHTGADFTHSMCPDCVQTLYPGLEIKV